VGRSSTALHALDVRDGPGRLHRLILRRYVDARRLAEDPWYRPEREAEALRIVGETSVPAPRLVAEDSAGLVCDFPALLETRIGGRALRRRPRDVERYLREAAEVLLQLHDVAPDRASALPLYAPYEPPAALSVPAWSSRPQLWTRALEVLAERVPDTEARFIHRDFHPGNILVGGGGIAGVVDWPTACRGPRSIDVARMRWNLVGGFGSAASDRFLELYLRGAGSDWVHDPYWDLLDAVDGAQDAGPPRSAAEAAEWDRFEQWVAAAL
jgi:aminoglycoside phosphotransferase (APT) family kinase protein